MNASFIVKRKDGQGEARTVDGAALLATCEEMSPGGSVPLDVTRLTARAPWWAT